MKTAWDTGLHLGVAQLSDDGLELRFWDTLHTGKDGCKTCKGFGNTRDRHEVVSDDLILAFTCASTAVAYERLRRYSSVDAANVLASLRGCVIRHAQRCGIECVSMEVSTWKKKIGVRGSSKEAYVARVNEITGLALTIDDEDAASAIGIALAAFCPDLSKLKVIHQ
jgi:Holliday junction resolvasome RuvABC endonuclease subunit